MYQIPKGSLIGLFIFFAWTWILFFIFDPRIQSPPMDQDKINSLSNQVVRLEKLCHSQDVELKDMMIENDVLRAIIKVKSDRTHDL